MHPQRKNGADEVEIQKLMATFTKLL